MQLIKGAQFSNELTQEKPLQALNDDIVNYSLSDEFSNLDCKQNFVKRKGTGAAFSAIFTNYHIFSIAVQENDFDAEEDMDAKEYFAMLLTLLTLLVVSGR